ncbi:MCE family protein [Gordonia sp. PDNC005]|uniref:MlaD family protein n=1 Tax=unclassified Gordonia (in: high G+C Gram-positive bacteria) TaxID=2657482 RepID=UPI0019627E67|nr:MlaD family protein [Gordonia sp. PDNC005]QRY63193.1 MCE family protein [Gordonia sp. PDNC005]
MALWIDPAGREPSVPALRVIGLGMTVVLVAVGSLLGFWSTGGFADRPHLILVTDRVGDGLAVGADVKYRGYRIGSVDSIEVQRDGGQRVDLAIDPGQFGGVTVDVVPAYFAPNMFAGTGVELVPTGHNPRPVRDGQELRVAGSSTSLGTLTSVLGRAGRLTSTLGDPAVYGSVDTLLRYSAPGVHAIGDVMPLLRQIVADQRMTLTEAMSDLTAKLDAIGPAVLPALRVVDGALDHAAYLDQPNGLRDVRGAVDGLSKRLVVPLGDILGRNQKPLLALINLGLDLGVPVVMSLGTAPQAYAKLTSLIRATGDAFAVQDDSKVRLLVEVLLADAPQITTPLLSTTVRGGRR